VAKGAIGFELRLVEPLIDSLLVWKIGVEPLIGDDLGGAFVAALCRLDLM
jgi:hypothetical protein